MANERTLLPYSHPSRRHLLHRCGMGMGSLGLATVAVQAGLTGPSFATGNPLLPRAPQFAPRAKRVLHLFANGGVSQVDTFDPKPVLREYAGKSLPLGKSFKTERRTGTAMPSLFEFKRYGKSGLEVSSLFPHVGAFADDLCVIRSMTTDVPNHEPSLLMLNCGDARQIRPSMGSWVTYGLGSENQNLPGYVVLCPKGYPTAEGQNWTAGFLPGVYAGTFIDSQHREVDQLVENVHNVEYSDEQQRRQLEMLRLLNRRHQDAHPADSDASLEARIQAFELGFRMQAEASDAFDIQREPAKVRERYGDTEQGRQMLLARRLLERGVRFVQVYSGFGQPWDSHENLEREHGDLAQACDRPIAALLGDLKASGLLDETLVIWGGEFGRTPTVEMPTAAGIKSGRPPGRDHNHYGFTVWLAGGGVKRGHVHGATDELGFRAVEGRMHVHDLHATILHLLGFDHETLTYRYAGRDFRLTDVAGRVVRELFSSPDRAG